jgi:hypothetical protein
MEMDRMKKLFVERSKRRNRSLGSDPEPKCVAVAGFGFGVAR